MITRICKPTDEAIAEAAQLLQAGELVAFPTETVYGLGANALDEEAVPRIYAAKGRPSDNPLIVHVGTFEAVEPLCYVSDASRTLMDAFWPGPLTLLMPKKPIIPKVTNAGLASVAIRMPSHPVALAMLRACKVPIAAPSANTSGRPSPTTAQHVLDDLNGKLPLILDGGNCAVGLESTVVDMTADIPTIVRPGGVTPEMLAAVLPEVRVADSVMRPLKKGEKAVSPGMMYRHYAPKGQLTLVKGTPEAVQRACTQGYRQALLSGYTACILVFEEREPLYEGVRTLTIGALSRPETIAQELFAALRQMDDENVQVMFCEVVDTHGVGLAIMNRLCRAASFHILQTEEVAP